MIRFPVPELVLSSHWCDAVICWWLLLFVCSFLWKFPLPQHAHKLFTDDSDGQGQSSQRKNALTLIDPGFSNFQRGARATRVKRHTLPLSTRECCFKFTHFVIILCRVFVTRWSLHCRRVSRKIASRKTSQGAVLSGLDVPRALESRTGLNCKWWGH